MDLKERMFEIFKLTGFHCINDDTELYFKEALELAQAFERFWTLNDPTRVRVETYVDLPETEAK